MMHGSKKIIKHKVGLLNLAEELGDVSQACRIMGLSRDTFYRYKSAVDENGLDALFDKNRRKPNIKNRVGVITKSCVWELGGVSSGTIDSNQLFRVLKIKLKDTP